MALIGDPRSLREFGKRLRSIPITASAAIAARAAPEISGLAGSAYDSGQTVYGHARPRGVDGQALSLEKTGASRRAVEFRATGRDIRTAPLPKYTRYLIGKYDILPNGPLPQIWRLRMLRIATEVLIAHVKGTL